MESGPGVPGANSEKRCGNRSCATIFKKDYPRAELIIAGRGPLQPELEMLAGGLGIARDVHNARQLLME